MELIYSDVKSLEYRLWEQRLEQCDIPEDSMPSACMIEEHFDGVIAMAGGDRFSIRRYGDGNGRQNRVV